MKIPKKVAVKIAIFALTIIAVTTLLSSCSNSKQKASGALKRTQYCEFYRELDEKFATAKPNEQKKLLEKVTSAKDFPENPKNLAEDFKTMIDGYDKFAEGTYNVSEQDTYKKASLRIQRHAIDNCELLKSKSGSKI